MTANDNISNLLANITANAEPVAHLPKSSLAGPLVITVEVLESIESGKMDWRKLAGWKWDILWTYQAMKWLASRELL